MRYLSFLTIISVFLVTADTCIAAEKSTKKRTDKIEGLPDAFPVTMTDNNKSVWAALATHAANDPTLLQKLLPDTPKRAREISEYLLLSGVNIEKQWIVNEEIWKRIVKRYPNDREVLYRSTGYLTPRQDSPRENIMTYIEIWERIRELNAKQKTPIVSEYRKTYYLTYAYVIVGEYAKAIRNQEEQYKRLDALYKTGLYDLMGKYHASQKVSVPYVTAVRSQRIAFGIDEMYYSIGWLKDKQRQKKAKEQQAVPVVAPPTVPTKGLPDAFPDRVTENNQHVWNAIFAECVNNAEYMANLLPSTAEGVSELLRKMNGLRFTDELTIFQRAYAKAVTERFPNDLHLLSKVVDDLRPHKESPREQILTFIGVWERIKELNEEQGTPIVSEYRMAPDLTDAYVMIGEYTKAIQNLNEQHKHLDAAMKAGLYNPQTRPLPRLSQDLKWLEEKRREKEGKEEQKQVYCE